MLESIDWPIPRALISLAEATNEVLCLRRHRLRVLETSEVLHHLLHLQLADVFVPNGMPPRHQVEHYDSRGPDVGLLGVGKNVRHLLGRLIEEGATLGEVSDRVEGVLNCQSEIKKFYFGEIFVAP